MSFRESGTIPFDYKGNEVRTVEIHGEHWFVAKDVCDILDIEARDYVRYLDDDEKSYMSRKHIGLHPGRDIVIVNEPGLYSLIIKSRKKEAKAFKRWITHEVLPQIRKTGVVVSRLDDDETGIHTVNTSGGNRRVSIVNER